VFSGNFPWEHAQEADVYYNEYIQWHRQHQIHRRFRLPSQWYRFTNRLMKLFRKMLDPEPLKRCELNEIGKYYDDRWINDCVNSRRRSSNEDEGVEEDFSSSGSGIELNSYLTKTKTQTDFEELTQIMRNSLTSSNENRQTTKTFC